MSQKQMGHAFEIVAVVLFVTGDFVGVLALVVLVVVVGDEVKCEDNPSCSLSPSKGKEEDCSCSSRASLDERREGVMFNDEDATLIAASVSRRDSLDCLSSSSLPTSISLY